MSVVNRMKQVSEAPTNPKKGPAKKDFDVRDIHSGPAGARENRVQPHRSEIQ
ncbi:MAG: hypothetical protein ACLFOY_00865 [Desulfatibacillaceae bacterium]